MMNTMNENTHSRSNGHRDFREIKASYRFYSLTLVQLALILLCSACGLIMEDPHPYPDMGGAGDEAETGSEPTPDEE